MLCDLTMFSICKCSLILDFNRLQSQHWLYFRIIWGALKIPNAQATPQANQIWISGVGYQQFLVSRGDSNV